MAWWDVTEFLHCLEKLAANSQLSFFDMIKEQDKMLAKERLNPLLPILATAIFSSKTIKTSVKLPIAVRLHDVKTVTELLSQTIAIDRKHGLVSDGRLLAYAAYHDLGTIVQAMIESGFEESQLDQLIMLEIRRELDGRKQPPDTPPDWYVPFKADKEERDLLWRKMSKVKRKQHMDSIRWEMLPNLEGCTFEVSRDRDNPENYGKSLTQTSVRTTRKTVTRMFRIKSSASAEALPGAAGRAERNGSALELTLSKEVQYYERTFKEKDPEGNYMYKTWLQPMSAERPKVKQNDGAEEEGVERKAETHSKHKHSKRHPLEVGRYTPVMDGSEFPLEHGDAHGDGQHRAMLIRATLVDDTVIRLPLEGQCRFHVRRSMRRKVDDAFGLWRSFDAELWCFFEVEDELRRRATELRDHAEGKRLDLDAGARAALDFAVQAHDHGYFAEAVRMFDAALGTHSKELTTHGGHGEHQADVHDRRYGLDSNSPMHDLLRLFWAIQSNRPRLAKALLYRSKRPIVAAFFMAYCYKHAEAPLEGGVHNRARSFPVMSLSPW
jgi:hypothetical protein